HPPSLRRAGQVAQQRRQVHLRVPGLEAELQRGRDAALGLGLPRRLAEKRSESRRNSSAGASASAFTRSFTALRPAAGNPAMRRASRSTNPSSSAAGSARLIQPYRSASTPNHARLFNIQRSQDARLGGADRPEAMWPAQYPM